MYARIKDGIITELCSINPMEIYCRELAESFYPCGEELSAGDMVIITGGVLYRDAQSMAQREQQERERLALENVVKIIQRERELYSLLELLEQSGATLGALKGECEDRLSSGVLALCAALGLEVISSEPAQEDIDMIKEALYHGGN